MSSFGFVVVFLRICVERGVIEKQVTDFDRRAEPGKPRDRADFDHAAANVDLACRLSSFSWLPFAVALGSAAIVHLPRRWRLTRGAFAAKAECSGREQGIVFGQFLLVA